MDLSQLCSTTSPDNQPITTFQPPPQGNESSDQKHEVKPSSLDFILLPHKEAIAEPNSELPISTELVFDQCSKLCESIWQLKLQHKSISVEEREVMIDNLSKLAQSLFSTIRSSDDWVSKDNYKKRDCVHSPFSRTRDEEEAATAADDDEYEEGEQDDENTQATTGNESSNHKDHAEYELIRQARNLQDAQSKPNYRRRNRRSMAGMKCHSCGTSSTPEWRRGPDGARTLCNACGLHYSKLLKKGSIGVQTNNYLLTGGIPPESPSIVSATAISQNSRAITNSSSTSTASPLINFPFVLMDPKYGIEKKLSLSAASGSITSKQNNISNNSTASTTGTPSSANSLSTSKTDSPLYTPQPQQQPALFFRPPAIIGDNQDSSSQQQQQKFVNISSPQLPLPSLSQQDLLPPPSPNNNNTGSSSSNKRSNNAGNTNSNQNNITPLRIHQWKNS